MKSFTVTANRTADGAVVYLRDDRQWTADIASALVRTDPAAMTDLLAWARAQQRDVCDPYPLEVQVREGAPAPVGTRERIRAAGPDATLRSLGYAS